MRLVAKPTAVTTTTDSFVSASRTTYTSRASGQLASDACWGLKPALRRDTVHSSREILTAQRGAKGEKGLE